MSFTKSAFRNYFSILIVGCCCAAQSAQAAVVAYWEFEPGNLTADSSGNSNTLSSSNVGSSLDVPGTASSGSAAFNGTNAFMQTASSLDLSAANQLTVEFFYKANGDFISSANIVFEHSANFNSNNGAIVTFGTNPGSSNNFNAGYRASGYSVDAIVGAPVTDWHHVAIQFDRTAASPAANSDVVKAYLDYNLVGVDTILGSGRAAFLDDTFFLGARNGGSLFYDGLLDQVRISDVLLTPSQFLQADAPPVPEPSSLMLLLLGSLFLKGISRRLR